MIKKIDPIALSMAIALIAAVGLALWLSDRGINAPPGSSTDEFRALSPDDPGYIPPNSLSLSPGRIIINVAEQGRQLPNITLTNTTERKLKVDLGFFPYRRTAENGAPIFSTSEKAFRAGKRLVELGAYRFTLAPKEVRTVGARVVGQPKEVEAFGVVSAAVALPQSKTQLPANIDGQAGEAIIQPVLRLSSRTWIKFRDSGPARFAIGRPVLDQSSGGFLPQVEIEASGKSSVEPVGDFFLYRQGLLAATIPFGNNALIPPRGRLRVIADQLFDALAPGRYRLVAKAFSGDLAKQSSTQFRIGADGLVVGSRQILPQFSLRIDSTVSPGLTSSEPFPVQISVVNAGKRGVAPKLRLELVDRSSGQIVESETLRPGSIDPKETLRLSAALGPVPAGSYLLTIRSSGPNKIPLGAVEQRVEIDGLPSVVPEQESPSWLEDPLAALGLGMLLAAILALALVGIFTFSTRRQSASIGKKSVGNSSAVSDSDDDE